MDKVGLRDRRGAACCAPTMCMLRPYHVPPRLPRCPGCRCEAQNAARPRVPFGRPAIGPSAVRCPSACTRNAWIACAPPVCSTYRYRLLWLSAMSLMPAPINAVRSEEHTSELQSPCNLVCRLLLEKKKKTTEPLSSGNID